MNRQYLINYSIESTKTLQTESTWSCAIADAKHLVVRLNTRSEDLFNEVVICAIFISVNAF